MNKDNKESTFLYNFSVDLEDGKYDSRLDLPFMNRDILISSVEEKINYKLSSGESPELSEKEVQDVILDIKKTSIEIAKVFHKIGLIDGFPDRPRITRKGGIAIIESSKD